MGLLLEIQVNVLTYAVFNQLVEVFLGYVDKGNADQPPKPKVPSGGRNQRSKVPALVGAAQELGHDLARLLAALAGDPLQALCVVTLDADQDRQLGIRIAFVHFDLTRAGAVKLGVKVAGLRIGVGPRILLHLN